MNIFAVIPARAGSKRIEGKNLKELSGKPIIEHVISKLLGSNIFSGIFVSTDSPRIAELAASVGAKVPFLREPKLADDFAGTHEVILDLIQKTSTPANHKDIYICVYPTAVMLEISDLQKAIRLCESYPESYVFSAHQPNSSPFRAFTPKFTGEIEFLFPEYLEHRSQDLPVGLVDSGQFYVGMHQTWCAQPRILNSQSRILEIPSSRALDLNTEEDWKVLQAIFEAE